MEYPFFVASPALSQGIVAARMEGVAFQQSFDAEKAALEKPVSFKRLNEIRGTGGIKTANRRKQG
jgi:hypothetical protein